MNLRYALVIIFSLSITLSSAQSARVVDKPFHEGPNCATLSLMAADEIADGLVLRDFVQIDSAIAMVTGSCGTSEVTIRMKILTKIMKHEDTSDDIRFYFDNQYFGRTRERILDSRLPDYGYHYAGREAWYGYVPLHHEVDTIAAGIARELSGLSRLTKDERLLCVLFSGDVEQFDAEWKSKETRDWYARTYWKKTREENGRNCGTLVFYSGIYSPIGEKKVFGNNPMFGVTLSTAVANKVSVELGVKIRINHNDQPFQYYAMGKTNEVNSGTAMFFGLIGGLKLYDRRNFIVQSRFGVGLESVDTGLSEPSKNASPNDPNSRDYHNVNTVHSSLGLAAMKGVGNGGYLGVEVGLHACPYGLDKDLRTRLDNMAASGELFFRF